MSKSQELWQGYAAAVSDVEAVRLFKAKIDSALK